MFILSEVEHATFERAGPNLRARVEITLKEALCGFSRVVIRHLDGRGILIDHRRLHDRVIKPGQIFKIPGEGMPVKKSDSKGDLYLVVEIKFPDGRLRDENSVAPLSSILPDPVPSILAETIDEVEYEEVLSLDEFDNGDEGQGDGVWVDDDEENDIGQPQCAQQ